MRRLVCVVMCALALARGLCTPSGALSTSAASAILIDAESGRVLYEHNAHEKRYIASITKLMTALVAMESGHSLDEVVTIKKEYTGAEGSSMYLKAGEELTLEALMYGLLLASGNDAALAVAGVCAGSVDAFVSRMNRRAAQLGMENTRFLNPSGLTQEGPMSTAADMARLAAACMNNETIARIVGTRSISIAGRSFTNHNKLLWQYEGCVGMKTGYTERAGRTLISCAQRNGQRLIVVTLDDGNDWADHTALFDYGFSAYTRSPLSVSGQVLTRVPVVGSLTCFVDVIYGADVAYPLTKGEQVRQEISLLNHTALPVVQGGTAGTVTWYLEGRVVGLCPLLYGQSAPRYTVGKSWLERLMGAFQ